MQAMLKVEAFDTWDPAAAAVVDHVFSRARLARDHVSQDWAIDRLRLLHDDLMDFMICQESSTSNNWSWISNVYLDIATTAALTIGYDRATESAFLDLLISKQYDYGPENILKFGHRGIIIRMHDKIARLEHLQSHGRNARNESVLDTFLDVIGYSVVGIMLERGWFTLPLEPR